MAKVIAIVMEHPVQALHLNAVLQILATFEIMISRFGVTKRVDQLSENDQVLFGSLPFYGFIMQYCISKNNLRKQFWHCFCKIF